MDKENFRSTVLDKYGASENEKEELLLYNRNVFDHSDITSPLKLPLGDELFVSAWERYAEDAKKSGVFHSLKSRLVQLSFPVKEGISKTQDYRSATLSGTSVSFLDSATGISFNEPESLNLTIHQSLAGKIPVLVADSRDDFVTLVRGLSMKNEPGPVPPSMGATMVSGLNNWDRINELKARWEAENKSGNWDDEFKRIIPQKDLYQDRFIILSSGPYSGVTGKDMELSEKRWKELSLIIRREHECAHYFTRRIFSSMRNNLIDELIADYMGITAADGKFRSDWFLRFLGLENFPVYRAGGRLENYRGKPELSDGAFVILQSMVKSVARNLEQFDADCRKIFAEEERRTLVLVSLTHLTLEELASEDACILLENLAMKLKNDIEMI
ncbi:MAG: hypothetical protein GY775_01010 [Candidatus Scalindua sp.]|nr:hypothetical protein [Candidatus Scalindua sp.]